MSDNPLQWEFQESPEESSNPLSDLKGLEDLALTGFVPAVTCPRRKHQPLAMMEAMSDHARGGSNIQKVQVDKVLGAQEVEEGGFMAHEVPQGLLTTNRAIDVDNNLKAVQQQQCALGLKWW